MRYSQMSDEQRIQLLDDPDNYPWRVTFLGKTGLLSFEALDLLRRHEVDFDVDDNQIAERMAEILEKGGLPAPPRGCVIRVVSAVLAGLALLGRAMRSAAAQRKGS